MRLLSGLKAHLWQRISAVYLLVYFPFAWWWLSTAQMAEYSSFRDSLMSMVFLLPSLLAIGLLLSHVWIGLRDVMLDYLPRRFVVPGLVVLGGIILLVMVNVLVVWRELSMAGGA